MTQLSKLLIAGCFAFAFGLVLETSAPQLEAQIVRNACGCGNAKCGGCLKGKLFPAKLPTKKVRPKKSCQCEACQKAAGKSVVTSDVLISREYLPGATSVPMEVAPVPMEVAPVPIATVVPIAAPCGCGKKRCRCKPVRKIRVPQMPIAPQPDCDFCELKVSKTKEKKKRFEVTQKEVCIPPVRLPWKKCCPPTRAKVRVVNVLKSKSYEAPGCKYEWKVYEPEVPKTDSDSSNKAVEASAETAPVKEVDPVDSSAPEMKVPEVPQVEKLDLENVPDPPVAGK